jgi:polyhydroxybutyrate depolymerase
MTQSIRGVVWGVVGVLFLAFVACQSSPVSNSERSGRGESQVQREGRVLDSKEPASEPTREPKEPAKEPIASDATTPEPVREPSPPEPRLEVQPEPPADKKPPVTKRCQSRKKQAQNKLWLTTLGLSVRRFIVHIPKGYDPNRAYPVVLNIHGHSSTDWQQLVLTDLNKKSDQEGFIVVHPQSGTVPPSWNADGCCPPANTIRTRDIDFFKKMLAQVQKEYCVDEKRIYSTGMTNGGMMSYKLASELSDNIVAIAPVAGAMVPKNCKPKRPLSVIVFHGTADLIVPYTGSALLGFPSTADSVAFWVKHNQCPAKSRETYKKGDVRCETWGPCAKNTSVVLCTVKDGGHTWPGGFPLPTGKTTRNINATNELWKFFKPLRLP